jgi:hypothetical protein
MEQFLIGTGIALLMVLIGWSEQIGNLHKDTMEVEKEFSNDRKVKWSKIRPLIRSNSTPEQKLKALNIIVEESNFQDTKDIDIMGKLSELDEKRCQLESLYNIKYILILCLTSLFFISGTINYFISASCKTNLFWFEIPTEFIFIFICVIFSFGILFYNIYLNSAENKYKDKLIQLKDQL